jgi:hypothetical protein
LRNLLALFKQALNNHLNYLLQIFQRLIGSLSPSGRTLIDQRWTVQMKAVLIWLHNHFKMCTFSFFLRTSSISSSCFIPSRQRQAFSRHNTPGGHKKGGRSTWWRARLLS